MFLFIYSSLFFLFLVIDFIVTVYKFSFRSCSIILSYKISRLKLFGGERCNISFCYFVKTKLRKEVVTEITKLLQKNNRRLDVIMKTVIEDQM